jgi:hypothetical protein
MFDDLLRTLNTFKDGAKIAVPVEVSNRSHATSNRVSDAAIRILKIRDQRLASEIARLRRKIQKITRQRLRDISLTLGNVGRIFATRT